MDHAIFANSFANVDLSAEDQQEMQAIIWTQIVKKICCVTCIQLLLACVKIKYRRGATAGGRSLMCCVQDGAQTGLLTEGRNQPKEFGQDVIASRALNYGQWFATGHLVRDVRNRSYTRSRPKSLARAPC